MRRGTIRNVLAYIGRYKWLAFLSFVMAGVTVALTLLAPYLRDWRSTRSLRTACTSTG